MNNTNSVLTFKWHLLADIRAWKIRPTVLAATSKEQVPKPPQCLRLALSSHCVTVGGRLSHRQGGPTAEEQVSKQVNKPTKVLIPRANLHRAVLPLPRWIFATCGIPPTSVPGRVSERGSGRPGQGVSWPPKIRSWGKKLHMELMSDKCQSNGNDRLSNFNTLETTCLHSHTA